MAKNCNSKSYTKRYTLLFITLLSIAFFLIFSSLKHLHFDANADEGYYLKYATYVNTNGIDRFPDLFKDYIDNKDNWLFPNPLRIGFILISAVFVKIFGSTFMSLALLSLASYLAFLIISFNFTRKYYDEKTSLFFLFLLAFSPLNMAMARRALMDSTANLFYILSIWLFLDLLNKGNNLKYAIFVIIFSFSILVKETTVLLSPIFILCMLFYKYSLKRSINLKDLLSVTIYPYAIVGLAYMSFAGRFSYIVDTVEIILSSPKTNQYAILYSSGPWFRYLIDFMLLSPWVCILSTGFVFYCFTLKRVDSRISYFLIIFVLGFFVFNMFTKNIRYIIMLDMPMRLFAILMIKNIVETKMKNYSTVIIAVIVITISMSDYVNFNDLFVQKGISDPISYHLLRARKIIP